jgi:hypothetical protein
VKVGLTVTMSQELIFDKSLAKIMFVFKLTGIKIEPGKRNLTENLVFLFNFLWLNTDIVSALGWMLMNVVNGQNFKETTFVAPCVFLSVLGDLKFLFLILNQRKVQELTANLRELEKRKNTFEHVDEEKIIKPEIKFCDVVIKVLNVLNCLMIVVFDLSPLVLIAVKYYKTGRLELMLPFMDVYPFEAFNLRYWPFAYIHQIWSGSYCIEILYYFDYSSSYYN